MDIDKLEAGRELDTLVAEKVMGLVWKEGTGVGRYVGQRVEGWGFPDFPWVNPDGLPEYSTDIAAAWEVVEKLTTIPHSYEFYLSQQTDGWDVSFQHPGDRGGQAHASTATLAICCAALQATLEGSDD